MIFSGGRRNWAGVEVGKSTVFNAPGTIKGKETETKFGGALELGSKEAYSAVVKNVIGMSERGEQRQIAANTARTAAAQERSEALLRQIAGNGGGVERRALTPRNPAAA